MNFFVTNKRNAKSIGISGNIQQNYICKLYEWLEYRGLRLRNFKEDNGVMLRVIAYLYIAVP
jgi:hypothetical protein